MPWKDTNIMELRIQFITDWLKRTHTVSDLCALYGISRKSGYKWIERYQHEGPDWVLDRSHVARVVANKTPLEVEQALMQMRALHPTWGARKLLHLVGLQQPGLMLPHESTVCDMLKRNGLITAKPRRRAIGHPGRPSSVTSAPNDSWSADFKGQFRLGNGQYTYPLTVTDNYSRYLLECQCLDGTLLVPTKEVFTRVFKEHGLPRRIKTDNGSPFAAATLGRLSQLSVWWLRLGILPELSEPGKPQQNGRHERMHRTLKAEATKPPGHEHAGVDAPAIAQVDAQQAAGDGLPGPLRGALRQRQRRHTLAQAVGEREQRAGGPAPRPGGGGRRTVGRVLRGKEAGKAARAAHENRRPHGPVQAVHMSWENASPGRG